MPHPDLASWLYLKFPLWFLLRNSLFGLGRKLLAFGCGNPKWLLCVDPNADPVCIPKVSAALFLHWVAADSCYFCPASTTGTGWFSPSKTIWVMWLRSAQDLGENKVSVFNSFIFPTSFIQLAVRIRELLSNFFPSSHGISLLAWCFGGLWRVSPISASSHFPSSHWEGAGWCWCNTKLISLTSLSELLLLLLGFRVSSCGRSPAAPWVWLCWKSPSRGGGGAGINREGSGVTTQQRKEMREWCFTESCLSESKVKLFLGRMSWVFFYFWF